MVLVLAALARCPESRRRAAYDETMLCRRRDRTDWRDTPVDAVFAHTDEQHLIRIRDLALRVKSQVRERQVSLHMIFMVFIRTVLHTISSVIKL